eukprot:s874_g5.t2
MPLVRQARTCVVVRRKETAASLDGSFLCRDEVVQVSVIFQHCASKGTFDISHADAERITGVAIDPKFWIGKLHRALDEMDVARHNGVKISFTAFLKKLCPKAANRHLRMFHSWLKEYEHMDELRAAVVRSREMVASFKAYTAKPPLPAKIRQQLLEGFEAGSAVMAFDRPRDNDSSQPTGALAEMGKDDYFEKRCPIEFRAHPGHPKVDDLVGAVLQILVTRAETALAQKERLFAPKKAYEAPTCLREMFVKPRVSDETWQLWNQVLDLLQVQALLKGYGPLVEGHCSQLTKDVSQWLCKHGQSHDGDAGALQSFFGFLLKDGGCTGEGIFYALSQDCKGMNQHVLLGIAFLILHSDVVSDEPMTLSTLQSRRMVCPSVVSFVYGALVGEGPGLTREGLLKKMCELSNCRMGKPRTG